MVTEQIKVSERPGIIHNATGEIYIAVSETPTGYAPVPIETTQWIKAYLSAEDDPVLAELWNNDDDAVFDTM